MRPNSDYQNSDILPVSQRPFLVNGKRGKPLAALAAGPQSTSAYANRPFLAERKGGNPLAGWWAGGLDRGEKYLYI
ncbi:MAG: hypothetical protein LBC27_05595 [Spirochaetaceae bacterium]|jgi:hypothetical protein|nr:hypothetical protein [Spirochaetaceae bacterium]